MYTINKIDDLSTLKPYYLCFLSKSIQTIDNIHIDSDITKDVFLWFYDDITKLNGVPNYNDKTTPPVIDREFYILHIKNFIDVKYNGIEPYTSQRDGWCTFNDIFRLTTPISVDIINNSGTFWLYNNKSQKNLNSSSLLTDVIKIFKDYDFDIYRTSKK